MILDDWQKEILEAKGNILLCTGRQVGKTTIFAMKAAERMLKKPNQTILVVSLTEDQAQLIIIMILSYLEKHAPKSIATGKNRPTRNIIQLKNGSKVRSRPVGMTGDSVRGFTGDVLIVDEASRMNEDVWTAAKPTLLTTAGEIWLCSTPYGRKGYFYECYQNKERFKVFHVSSEEVIMNRKVSLSWTQEQRDAAIKYLENEKKDMSSLRYAQEYLGQFVDDLRQYFPDELIKKCMLLERTGHINRYNDHFLGCDIARMGEDEGTYEILELSGDMLLHRENLVTKKQLTTDTERMIIMLERKYDFNKIFIDAGAGTLGVSIFDHLLEHDDTRTKIVAINNLARPLDKEGKKAQRLLKEDLYDNLRSLMEKGKIQLLNDENLFYSLKSVQYEFKTKDKDNKPIQSQLMIFGDYTHIAEGLIRAAWGIKYKGLNISIHSIRI